MDILPEIIDHETEPDIIDEEGDINPSMNGFNETAEEPEPEPEPEEKPPATMEEIFDGVPSFRKIKDTKPKKKRVLTEEHKEKLKLAREKALITRRKNAAKRKEIKDLEKRKEENKLNQLRKEAGVEIKEPEPEPEPKQELEPPKICIDAIDNHGSEVAKMYNMTAEQIEELQMNAIANYDTVRLKRKEKKKRAEEKQRQVNQVKEELKEIITPSQAVKYGKEGYWNDFF